MATKCNCLNFFLLFLIEGEQQKLKDLLQQQKDVFQLHQDSFQQAFDQQREEEQRQFLAFQQFQQDQPKLLLTPAPGICQHLLFKILCKCMFDDMISLISSNSFGRTRKKNKNKRDVLYCN